MTIIGTVSTDVLQEDSEHQEIPDQLQLLRREVGESEGTDGLLALDDGLQAEWNFKPPDIDPETR